MFQTTKKLVVKHINQIFMIRKNHSRLDGWSFEFLLLQFYYICIIWLFLLFETLWTSFVELQAFCCHCMVISFWLLGMVSNGVLEKTKGWWGWGMGKNCLLQVALTMIRHNYPNYLILSVFDPTCACLLEGCQLLKPCIWRTIFFPPLTPSKIQQG